MNTQPNQDDVAAFMEELGFKYSEEGGFWRNNKDPYQIHDVLPHTAQFWYTTLQQSNRQLLDEVEATGPKKILVPKEAQKPVRQAHYLWGFNDSDKQWHQAIQAIKERNSL